MRIMKCISQLKKYFSVLGQPHNHVCTHDINVFFPQLLTFFLENRKRKGQIKLSDFEEMLVQELAVFL